MDIGTDDNPEVLNDDEAIENHLSNLIKQEFEDNKSSKVTYEIGDIDPVDLNELQQAINLIKLDKATSFDCTPDSIITHLKLAERNPQDNDLQDFRNNFLKIINDCFQHKEIPSEAQATRLMMLNKKPNEIPKPKNVRFIAIASILMKVIESIVLNRIKDKIKKRLSKSQLGFVEKGECGVHTVQLFNQLRHIQKQDGNSLKYYAVFIDFKSAFNRVNHVKLFEKCA